MKGNDNETLMRLVQKLMCKWGNEHGKANVQALSLERSTVGEQQYVNLFIAKDKATWRGVVRRAA